MLSPRHSSNGGSMAPGAGVTDLTPFGPRSRTDHPVATGIAKQATAAPFKTKLNLG